ncbi:MAG: hypothetical protein AB7E47_09840 [Desulfovibrionaceae bacterium]
MTASPATPATPAPKARGGSGRKRAKALPDLAELARGQVPEVVDRLMELMRSDNEKVAIAAAQELLNRAYGKAPAVAPSDTGGAEPVVIETCIPKDPGDAPGDNHP